MIWRFLSSQMSGGFALAACVSLIYLACVFAGKYAARVKRLSFVKTTCRATGARHTNVLRFEYAFRSLASFLTAILLADLCRRIFGRYWIGKGSGLIEPIDSIGSLLRNPAGLFFYWFLILGLVYLTSWYYRDKYLGKR